jgi:hypothetical protein
VEAGIIQLRELEDGRGAVSAKGGDHIVERELR